MKLLVLLAVVAIAVASRQRSEDIDRSSYLKNAKPFTSGHVYRFRYDSQIASGLGSVDTLTGTQQSTHRLSAMVNVHFENDRTATLRLEEIRIASLNGERSDLRRVQSMQLFDEHQIDTQKLEELQMPCSFKLNDGIVERIYFDEKDAAWSKNIKRAVLNLVQLNLKERNTQEQGEYESEDRQSMSNMFVAKETTLEGKCDVTYSINKVSSRDEEREVFNVTKTINFEKCSEIPSIYYGPRLAETLSMPRRQQQSEEEQQVDRSSLKHRRSEEQQLDRSTVLRYQLIGTPEKYAIANVELLSQYIYKTLSDEQAQAMQTVVASRLTIDSVEKRSHESRSERLQSKEESLQYSVEWDLSEKRFYQYGDEEFTHENSPFSFVQTKVTTIKSMIQKIVESSNDKTHGIETETTLKLQNAVELMRMCSVKEIEQIFNEIESKERELNIFMDICAIAGTRNTIHFLVDKIVKEDIKSSKAVLILRQLSSPFAISEKQVDSVLRLCKENVVEKSGPLRQACWLTAGSMIGELCKGSVRDNEMCSRHTEEKYQKALWTRYTEAENLYEKTIALKAIGNAANEFSVANLEKLIADRRESSILRIHAIDALRRLRQEMPRKIQRVLLPIFKNTLEVPEVRMTAFSMLMNTIPEKNILDQIAYTLHSERSSHVKSFVVSLFKAYSSSRVPEEREVALHLRSALTMAKVDLDMACRYTRIPIYSGEQQEGLFLNLISIFSTTDSIPKYLSVSLDSLLNGLLEKDSFRLSLSQNNVEDLYHRFMENWYGSNDRRSSIRASRSARNGEKELDSIFDDLKIKTREVFDTTPFGLINLRIRDVDQVVLPLGEEYMPTIIKSIMNGQKLTVKNLPTHLLEGKPMHLSHAFSLNERSMKIATSSGMPLRLLHSLPIISSMSGTFKVQMSSENFKVTMKLHPIMSGVHTQKMEIWCPVVNTGVESLRSVELNLPLDMEARVMLNNDEDKVRVVLNVPEQKTRLIGFHTLPLTFTREYNSQSGLHGKTHVKTIRNLAMESRQYEIESTDTSFSVNGHYHKLPEMTLSALYNLMWSTENHVQVTYDRKSECADAIEFILSSKLFQTAESSSSKPRFEQFYQDNKSFEPVYDDDVEDSDDLESNNARSKRLNTYLSSEYKPRAVYRHFIKTLIQTIGGKYNHKASARLEAICDSQMSFCKINTDIRRTPLLRGEKDDWTLKAESQILMPQNVQEISELNENDRRHNKLAVTVESQWGSEITQKLNLRLQGERSVPQQWVKRSGVEWRRALATAFINKYDLVADYKLTPHFQARMQHYFELLKFWNFWNSDSSEVMEGRKNEIRATLVIDPRTRQHMNVSVKTPTERTRLTNVRLSMPIKPFTLVRPQEQRYEITSVDDMITEYSDSKRAECRVDGRRIKTFDSVTYKAPIGNCYSVIAKDCARKSFVVLMKTIDEETEAKNIKIVTAKDTFEVELIRNKLVVKVNGEKMTDESQLNEYNIDYSEDLVRVLLPGLGVSVRFDGKQAKVKLSKYYKDAQCGLCGTMNDDQHDEFRMNDNTLTDDVKTFHRSFSMVNDDCDNVYDKNTLFGLESSSQRISEQDRDDYEDEDMNEEIEEYGMFDRRQQDVDAESSEEPISKTKVTEYNHKICFSVKPFKECPREKNAQKVDNIKLHFACFDRSSTEARRFLRESRNNDITSKLSHYKPSFAETVRSARVCA